MKRTLPAWVPSSGIVRDKQIIPSLQDLSSETKSSTSVIPTLSSLGLPESYIEVTDRTAAPLIIELDRIADEVDKFVPEGKNPYKIPSRSDSNHIYLSALDRFVLKEKYSTKTRSFNKKSTQTKRMAHLMKLIRNALEKNITISKRDVLYRSGTLFENEDQLDHVIHNIACMFKCTRRSLHIVGSPKGALGGNLTFTHNGLAIDGTKLDPSGQLISSFLHLCENLESKALFILLIEKEASFMRVSEDRFFERFPCILITGKGKPDVATRLFLKRLKTELKLPVFGLMDMDPHGLEILLTYRCGSKVMSYDSSNLATPDIDWLGLRPIDIKKFGVHDALQQSMTKDDRLTAKDLLKGGSLDNKDKWFADLNEMLGMRKKVVIQSLGGLI